MGAGHRGPAWGDRGGGEGSSQAGQGRSFMGPPPPSPFRLSAHVSYTMPPAHVQPLTDLPTRPRPARTPPTGVDTVGARRWGQLLEQVTPSPTQP